jgi:hypothetical protein
MAMNKDNEKNKPQQSTPSRSPDGDTALPQAVGGTPFPGPTDGEEITPGSDGEGKVGGGA